MKYQLCQCCTMWIVNRDDSGCRDFYGHVHQRPDLIGNIVVDVDDSNETQWDRWDCDGCGTEQAPGSESWAAESV